MKGVENGAHVRGARLAEGKTKIIYGIEDSPSLVEVFSKDDVTAGDGAKHDVIPGKGAVCTRVTCALFDLLKWGELPVAYVGPMSAQSLIGLRCSMIPLEVVVRRRAYGSYLKRNPDVKRGMWLDMPVELYLKTSGKTWRGISLSCDDPLVLWDTSDEFALYDPAVPLRELWQKKVLGRARIGEVLPTSDPWAARTQIIETARSAFGLLAGAFNEEGATLADIKFEFGIDAKGTLRIADVITPDEMRLLIGEQHFDKQFYRDGGDTAELLRRYEHVARITERIGSYVRVSA